LITSNTNLQLIFVDPFSEFNRLSIIKPRGKSDTSSKKMTFDNFVIDKKGNVKAVIQGTLKERATADLLLQHLKEIEGK
jgi:hypothetical protein